VIRVLRIITRLNVGGPAIQAISLSARLESAGYHTLLVHGRLGADEADMRYLVPADRRFEIEEIPSLQREIAPLDDIAGVARISRILRAFRPAIVHTHMAKAGTLGRIAAAFHRSASGSHAKIVHTYHGHVLDGYFSPVKARAFSAVERLLARRSDALIAVSPSVRDDLLRRHRIGDADRFHVVPLGFDLTALAAIGPAERSAARQSLDLAPTAPTVSFVGRLTAIKRPDLFLVAAQHISSMRSDVQFLVAGGGELEPSLRAQASALGIADRVRFLGWQQDVGRVSAASDVVALTSRNEGTPVAIIESIAAGVPAVAFDVGGVADVITSPDVGVLVGDGDGAGLANRVARLLTDADARARIGVRGRESVVARYGLDRLVAEIDRLYRRLL
jgi:glycosyltransferase involved in cell wall biosynthesis